MNWEKYTRKFSAAADRAGKDESYIKRCLIYGERLFKRNLPVIYSTEHLALLIGIDSDYLYSMVYSPSKFYRHFRVKKKSGGFRDIFEPTPDLKYVQRWILEEILSRVPVSPFAKAFIKGKSIKVFPTLNSEQRSAK